MSEGQSSGNGSKSPFGNGAGAPQAGPANGAHNFAKDASGTPITSSPPPRNFAAIVHKQVDPASLPPLGENLAMLQRNPKQPQTSAAGYDIDPAQVPKGGKILKADPGPAAKAIGAANPEARPFKNLR